MRTVRTSFGQIQDHDESDVQQRPVSKMLPDQAHTVYTSLDPTKDREQTDPGPDTQTQDGQIQDGQIHDHEQVYQNCYQDPRPDRQVQDQQQVGLTSHQEQDRRPNMLAQDDEVLVLGYFRADGNYMVKTLDQRC
jgi:hypothetical protein